MTMDRCGRTWLVSLVMASFLASFSVIHAFQLGVAPRAAFSRAIPLAMHDESFTAEDGPDKGRRFAEFVNLEPVRESEARRARLERDSEAKAQFASYGDELWTLRKKMVKLSEKLVGVLSGNGRDREEAIRRELRETELRDPELVYEMELLEMELARREGNTKHAEKARRRALNARSCLPPYNLEGLWVGKYGNHGYEMINVTYVGDTIIAYKVTGDKNVPRGEITFQADLTPPAVLKLRENSPFRDTKDHQSKPLEPIILTEKAASKWGTRQLPRYRGLGQVAETGFINSRWMDGQLIIIGEDYFSFAWVPLENQIFFGRPSPELSLKMLREGGMEPLRRRQTQWETPPSMDDDVEVLKDYVASCLEMTTETLEEVLPEGQPMGCIWHGGSETEECYFE